MQGIATYTGIGGSNMDGGIMTLDLRGSSAPGVVEDESGSTYNLIWTFPGGINNKYPDGTAWGYALQRKVPCTQADLEAWLKGETISDMYTPTRSYTNEEIAAASDPQMADDINTLMQKYLSYVMSVGDITKLRDGYSGCIILGK